MFNGLIRRRSISKIAGISLIVLGASTLSDSTHGRNIGNSEEDTSSLVNLMIDNDVISVDIRNASIEDLLAVLNRKQASPVEISGTIFAINSPRKVSLRFKRLPLGKGLQLLLDGFDHMLTYRLGNQPWKLELISHGLEAQATVNDQLAPSKMILSQTEQTAININRLIEQFGKNNDPEKLAKLIHEALELDDWEVHEAALILVQSLDHSIPIYDLLDVIINRSNFREIRKEALEIFVDSYDVTTAYNALKRFESHPDPILSSHASILLEQLEEPIE